MHCISKTIPLKSNVYILANYVKSIYCSSTLFIIIFIILFTFIIIIADHQYTEKQMMYEKSYSEMASKSKKE